MSELTIHKLDGIGLKLVQKIAQWIEKYQGDLEFDVSKIINLNVDVKNHVMYEVMDNFESSRK